MRGWLSEAGLLGQSMLADESMGPLLQKLRDNSGFSFSYRMMASAGTMCELRCQVHNVELQRRRLRRVRWRCVHVRVWCPAVWVLVRHGGLPML